LLSLRLRGLRMWPSRLRLVRRVRRGLTGPFGGLLRSLRRAGRLFGGLLRDVGFLRGLLGHLRRGLVAAGSRRLRHRGVMGGLGGALFCPGGLVSDRRGGLLGGLLRGLLRTGIAGLGRSLLPLLGLPRIGLCGLRMLRRVLGRLLCGLSGVSGNGRTLGRWRGRQVIECRLVCLSRSLLGGLRLLGGLFGESLRGAGLLLRLGGARWILSHGLGGHGFLRCLLRRVRRGVGALLRLPDGLLRGLLRALVTGLFCGLSLLGRLLSLLLRFLGLLRGLLCLLGGLPGRFGRLVRRLGALGSLVQSSLLILD
jgi:hypothetical protein